MIFTILLVTNANFYKCIWGNFNFEHNAPVEKTKLFTFLAIWLRACNNVYVSVTNFDILLHLVLYTTIVMQWQMPIKITVSPVISSGHILRFLIQLLTNQNIFCIGSYKFVSYVYTQSSYLYSNLFSTNVPKCFWKPSLSGWGGWSKI